jgi:hypothetical protein
MDPSIVVALVAGVFGLVGSYMAVRNTRKIEHSAAEVEATKVLVDGWARYAEQHRLELAEERSVTQAFSDKADRLETEVRALRDEIAWCREHHPKEPET